MLLEPIAGHERRNTVEINRPVSTGILAKAVRMSRAARRCTTAAEESGTTGTMRKD